MIAPPRKRVGPHGFKSVGDILRRMRGEVELQMTDTFNRSLSLRLDQLLDQEQRCEEGRS
jgi:hypothetical protein